MARETLNSFAQQKLDSLEAKSLRRRFVDTDRLGPALAGRDGKTLVSFCCNDYLNLSYHPEVLKAAQDATARYGVGSGASRLVTGNHPLFRQLEQRLAALKQADDCIIFGSGYLANSGIVPTLVGGNDLIFIDELAHACLFSGTQLSGARPFVFRHNDLAHLEDLLKTHRPTGSHALILTDGVFSMDGDLAPVEALAALANAHDAWLMTDDAHGIGVIGEGRGSSFVGGRKVDVPLQMGTLSKAIGGYGGYLCADQPVIDLMRTRARTVIYSTGLPPATIAAALKALDVIEANPEFAASPLKKANRFTRALGLPNAESPIVPLIMGDADVTLAASAFLESEGFLVTAIRPPTVPAGTARLRFTFTAEHRDEDIDRLAALVKEKILNKRAAE